MRSVDPAFDKSPGGVRFRSTRRVRKCGEATENLERRMVALTDKVQELLDQDVKQTLAGVQESSADLSEAAESVNMTSSNVGPRRREYAEGKCVMQSIRWKYWRGRPVM